MNYITSSKTFSAFFTTNRGLRYPKGYKLSTIRDFHTLNSNPTPFSLTHWSFHQPFCKLSPTPGKGTNARPIFENQSLVRLPTSFADLMQLHQNALQISNLNHRISQTSLNGGHQSFSSRFLYRFARCGLLWRDSS